MRSCIYGASGTGSISAGSKSVLDLAPNTRLVANAIDAVPTMIPATPHPIKTANPDDVCL